MKYTLTIWEEGNRSIHLFPICIVSILQFQQLRNESQLWHGPSLSLKGNNVFQLYQMLLNGKRVFQWCSPNYKCKTRELQHATEPLHCLKKSQTNTITEDFAYFKFCLFKESGLTHLGICLMSAMQKQVRLMEYLNDGFMCMRLETVNVLSSKGLPSRSIPFPHLPTSSQGILLCFSSVLQIATRFPQLNFVPVWCSVLLAGLRRIESVILGQWIQLGMIARANISTFT